MYCKNIFPYGNKKNKCLLNKMETKLIPRIKNQTTNKMSGSKRQAINRVQKKNSILNNFTIFMTVIIIKFK